MDDLTLIIIAVANLGGITAVAALAWNANRTLAQTLGARMDSLDTRMSSLEGAVRSLTDRVSALETLVRRVERLEERSAE
jgi:hypothetical protein